MKLKELQNPSSDALERELLTMTGQSPVFVPISVTAMAVLLCYMVSDSLSMKYWMPWLVLTCGFCYTRQYILKRLDKFSEKIALQSKIALSVAFVNGATLGSSVAFFPYYDFAERAVFTIILAAFSAGAITNTAGHRARFLSYSLPMLIPLGLVWSITDTDELNFVTRLSITGLIYSYIFIQLRNAASYYRLFKESFAIREKHAELNDRLQLALEYEVRANESKVRFLASASHDLRQPIHTLSLLMSALTLQELNSKSQKISNKMETAVDNLASLMDGLLDISKLDAGIIEPKFEHVSFSKMLERLSDEYQQLAAEKSISLEHVLPNHEVFVKSDPALLERVLRNIISNAIKYTDNGYVNIILEDRGIGFDLCIVDSGRGISSSELERVFDEFYQVENPHRDRIQGLGLGLAIVKRIATILELPISLESDIGKGSTFSMYIEYTSAPEARPEIIGISHNLGGLNILCVDDEIDILSATEILLTDMGCVIRIAMDLQEVIEAISGFQPDVVIADFRLAHNLNGVQVIKAVRERYPEAAALLISGDTDPARIQEASAAGVRLLTKPVNKEELQNEIAIAFANTQRR